jgi:hypothetical protein
VVSLGNRKNTIPAITAKTLTVVLHFKSRDRSLWFADYDPKFKVKLSEKLSGLTKGGAVLRRTKSLSSEAGGRRPTQSENL